ncbi:MAG: HD domain-containing protein [Candidatus Bipolaricaulis sp.]|nr:HD domain-containing protein [Candidatus Bipolaricaulis sp.]
MERLEALRVVVDGILDGIENPEDRRCGFVHLYGVSATAVLLALRRGRNAELAAAAGMLHDLATYETGTSDDHAARGARRASEILRGLGTFTDADVEAIGRAVAHHSDKAAVHDAFSELLKDADVLQHFVSNPETPPLALHAARREALRQELGL